MQSFESTTEVITRSLSKFLSKCVIAMRISLFDYPILGGHPRLDYKHYAKKLFIMKHIENETIKLQLLLVGSVFVDKYSKGVWHERRDNFINTTGTLSGKYAKYKEQPVQSQKRHSPPCRVDHHFLFLNFFYSYYG